MGTIASWVQAPKVIVFTVIALALIALGVVGFLQYRAVTSELTSLKATLASGDLSASETDALIAEVGKLMILPQGERPTVAAVTDIEKLRNQPLFVNAQNGDKVLIYTNLKKAIVYRPGEKKIVEVAVVNIGNRDAEATGSAETKTYTVTLRNGSPSVGLTRQYDPVLKEKAPMLTVSDRQNAGRKDFEKTFFVDVKGDKNTIAKAMATALGISLQVLPDGEASASSDFLIMLGADFASSVASPSSTPQSN